MAENQENHCPLLQQLHEELEQLRELPFPGARWLSVTDAARYLRLSVRTVYNSISKNSKTPFVKPKRRGGMILFDRLELDRWVESWDG